jgi:LysR family glycine cleavage system transcriptional activator
MNTVSHLKSLQALELALREGSLKAAAERLGVTPAAVGQRIKTLESYLGKDLLSRGRSGLRPTPDLAPAQADLRAAFEALERVTEVLNFQGMSEIHIVAEPDLSELWLMPRLAAFQQAYPNTMFCINGIGDIPIRIGMPDIRISCDDGPGEPLFRDLFVAVTGPDNPRRIADWDEAMPMEGMPLLHLAAHQSEMGQPGWLEWFTMYGQRKKGPERGVHYKNTRLALEAVRANVGFLVCGLSLVLEDLSKGSIVLPFSAEQHILAPHPYRLSIRPESENRPQVARFVDWLKAEADATRQRLGEMAEAGPGVRARLQERN